MGVSQAWEKIARDIIEVIDDIGTEKVVAIVTDNASSMRGAWTIIKEKNIPLISQTDVLPMFSI